MSWLTRLYHRYWYGYYSQLEASQERQCELLSEAHKQYKNSYYTDRWHEAEVRLVEIRSWIAFHAQKIIGMK